MLKRLMDVFLSVFELLVFLPFLIIVTLLIIIQDFQNPLYIATRVGRHKKLFKMVKLRSMIIEAETSGVDSTSSDDKRITWIGHLIRKIKLDEITQLWNVLIGNMSLVGPRPNVERDVGIYTDQEIHLLDVRPGITDFSSIVFADEGNILAGSKDPDLRYNQLIRPWKSRLGLFYIQHKSMLTDIAILLATVISVFSRSFALSLVQRLLRRSGCAEELLKVSRRKSKLIPHPPPGSDRIFAGR